MAVRRFDIALRLDAPKRTPQGFLIAPGAIARTGVQAYRQPDGTVRNEYRPPEEVFHADALASFAAAPVTLGHPDVPVTSANAKDVTVGFLSQAPFRTDDNMVGTTLVVMDAKAIAEAESGNAAQLSCGYECDVDDVPGVSPEGVSFHGTQRNIRGNHVALVTSARAGPNARLKLDSKDAEQIDLPAQNNGGRTMAIIKMKIDGYEHDLDDRAALAIEKERKAHADALTKAETAAAAATAAIEKEKARADAAIESEKKTKKDLADATDPAKIKARVDARVVLIGAARALAGNKLKLDGLDEAAVHKAVVAELFPDLKLDDKSAAYIEGRFDHAVEELRKVNPAALVRADVLDPEDDPAAQQQRDDADDPRGAFMREQEKRAKEMGKTKK